MPREFTRSDRVSDAIQRLLGQVIPNEIRDPRIAQELRRLAENFEYQKLLNLFGPGHLSVRQ